MQGAITPKTAFFFVLGFVLGKLVGAFVSTSPLLDLVFDPDLSSVFYSELWLNFTSLNGYHLFLGLIGGLILAVWKSEGVFE